jgi:Trk K+ transport system NAD-binding subunit
MNRDPSHPILVVGLDPVGIAIVHRLHALNLPVQALVTPEEGERQGAALAALGVDVIPGSAGWVADLERLDLHDLGAVVLAANDDATQVDACLVVRRRCADVPVLARVSDPTLVRFLVMTVPHVDVFSMGSTTAPVAADLAVHLLATERPAAAPARRRPKTVRPRPATQLWTALAVASVLSVGLCIAFVQGLVLAPLLAAALFGVLASVVLTSGIGLVVDMLITRRLRGMVAGLAVARRDHVVVVGAGNVGMRVAELLAKRKVPVVVIEAASASRNVQRLAGAGIPVVAGDATLDETLERASVWDAKVVLVLTNNDAVNLHVALRLRDVKAGVPTVVRLLSPELQAHLGNAVDLNIVSPVLETATHVCKAAEHERAERCKQRQAAVQVAQDLVAGMESTRTTGRFAGLEFEPPAAPGNDGDEVSRAA